MIRRLDRLVGRFLGSPKLALVLLIGVGAWSMLATAIPQTSAGATAASAWIAARGWIGTAASFVGLTNAFTSPVFLVMAILLAASTAVCCWSRTRRAISRSRLLMAASRTSREELLENHDVEFILDTRMKDDEALAAARSTLGAHGLRLQERDGVLRSVSAPLSVWGSPIFHWSLLAIMLAALVGVLVRSEGSMPVITGATVADQPSSYTSLNAGAWHDWARVQRSIRVDAFEPDLVKDGIDRGAVPTVSVLDASGATVVTQQVYANMKLHAGSLSINAPTCGLVVTLALLDSNGAEVRRVSSLVSFSQDARGGTVPLRDVALKDATGNAVFRISASVPLERSASGYGEWIPKDPSAHIVVTSRDGVTLLDRVVQKGEAAAVPGTGSIKVVDFGWYALLSLVDDPTIPFVYAAMFLAALGLSLSVLAPQRLVVVAAGGSGGRRVLALDVRLWRNNPTSRSEIMAGLSGVLGPADEPSGDESPVNEEDAS